MGEVLERCAEESKGTERTDNVAELAGLNPTAWTPDEQKLLEQALKTYDSKTPERWERISEAVPGRSKKDCMKRYKELAEIVKAKKAAACSFEEVLTVVHYIFSLASSIDYPRDN